MRNKQSVHLKARVMVRGEGIIVLLQWLWELRGSMQREGQAPRPTKSEWDSAVLEGVVRCEGLLSFCNGCGNGKVRCNGRSELYSVIT